MNTTIQYVRLFFLLFSILLLGAYATTHLAGGFTPYNLAIGVASGCIVALALILTERFFKRYSIFEFNICILGLLFGYCMGFVLLLFMAAVIGEEPNALFKASIYLVSCYFGMVMTIRSSEDVHLSIPFVKFHPATQKKKDLIVDYLALTDTRLIDLAASGLLDHQLVVPRFLVKELYQHVESLDEGLKARARRALEVLKKMEGMTTLGLRFNETDFSDVTDFDSKIVRLARLMDANVITGDLNRVKQSAMETTEGLRVINIHHLANSLKPLSQSGEAMEIKIQRYGKEPGQGVGYLEDGTMVVVNGGAEFIGKMLRCQVLSVKHTSSGRMIFCNASDEFLPYSEDGEKTPLRSYFAVER